MKTYVYRKKSYRAAAAIVDAAGFFLARVFLFCKGNGDRAAPRRVLIVRLDHLGDVLWATAVPAAVKKCFPDCQLTFLAPSWAAALLENNPYVDETLIFDARWFSKGRYSGAPGTLSFLGLIRELRKRKMDLAIGLRGDLREHWILTLARIPRRVSFGITGGGFLLTREVAHRTGVHETEHHRDLLEAAGIKCNELRPLLYFSEEEEHVFQKKSAAWGLDPLRPWTGFQAFAGTPSKNWPVKEANFFLENFKKEFPDATVILLGVRNTDEIEEPFRAEGCVDLRGKTSLRELCLLIKKLSFFVGPDSGPAHIASALGVPTVFLFSGTNVLERWRPLSASATILRNEVPCSPCHLELCPVPGHPCMSGISADQVMRALEEKMKRELL